MTPALVTAWLLVIAAVAHRLRPAPARCRQLVGPLTPRKRRHASTIAAIVAALAIFPIAPPLSIALVALGCFVPAFRRRGARRRNDEAIARALPDLVDLFRLAIHAGLTPRLALDRVGPIAPLVTQGAIGGVLMQLGRGRPFADAITSLIDVLGEPIRPLVSALTVSERHGMALAPALELLAVEARNTRRRRAETVARQVPVKLCFPLVGCILPAFILLSVAPLLIGALGSLRL